MMRLSQMLISLGLILLIGLYPAVFAQVKTLADTIYLGGDLVTINDLQPSAEAIAIKNGKILALGKESDVMQYKGPDTAVVNLHGHTLCIPWN